jgi:hypothetical protein
MSRLEKQLQKFHALIQNLENSKDPSLPFYVDLIKDFCAKTPTKTLTFGFETTRRLLRIDLETGVLQEDIDAQQAEQTFKDAYALYLHQTKAYEEIDQFVQNRFLPPVAHRHLVQKASGKVYCPALPLGGKAVDDLTMFGYVNLYCHPPALEKDLVSSAEIPPYHKMLLDQVFSECRESHDACLRAMSRSVYGSPERQSVQYMLGAKGIGKGLLMEHVLAPQIGSSCFKKLNNQFLNSDFNSELMQMTVGFIDECGELSEKAANTLKNLTNTNVRINPKGENPIFIKSYASYWIAANECTALAIDYADRRTSLLHLTQEPLEAVFGKEKLSEIVGGLATERRAFRAYLKHLHEVDLHHFEKHGTFPGLLVSFVSEKELARRETLFTNESSLPTNFWKLIIRELQNKGTLTEQEVVEFAKATIKRLTGKIPYMLVSEIRSRLTHVAGNHKTKLTHKDAVFTVVGTFAPITLDTDPVVQCLLKRYPSVLFGSAKEDTLLSCLKKYHLNIKDLYELSSDGVWIAKKG